MEDIKLSDNILRPKEYFEQLAQEFPDLRSMIDNMGVYYNMERFADYTIKQVKKSNWNKLKDCFAFQEQRINILSSDLENALIVSYCESLLLGGHLEQKLLDKVVEFMGPQLQRIYKDYETDYNKLVNPKEK